MPETATQRKYQLTRISAGDYLLPSNDAQILWRLRTYEEDGSAEDWNGRKIIGSFWSVWRWDGGFPTGEQIAASIETDDYSRWMHWAGPLRTRKEAIAEALSRG